MTKTSDQIRETMRSVNIHARVAFGRHRLVMQEIDRAKIAVNVGLLHHQGAGDPDQQSLGGYLNNEAVRHIGDLKVLRELIEESPQFAEATEKLVPLALELEAALAREHEEALAVAAAANALADAETAAREKLEAKIAADPAVAKARAALAGVKRLGEALPELASDHQDLVADFHG